MLLVIHADLKEFEIFVVDMAVTLCHSWFYLFVCLILGFMYSEDSAYKHQISTV